MSALKPAKVNILGINYRVEYVDNPSDVDPQQREVLRGHIDYLARTIRIYDKDVPNEEVFHTLLHEILHGIKTELHLACFDDDAGHDELDILALALADVLFRNGFIKGHK